MQNVSERDYWPTHDWKTKTPQEVSVNPERLKIQPRIIMNDFVLPSIQ